MNIIKLSRKKKGYTIRETSNKTNISLICYFVLERYPGLSSIEQYKRISDVLNFDYNCHL